MLCRVVPFAMRSSALVALLLPSVFAGGCRSSPAPSPAPSASSAASTGTAVSDVSASSAAPSAASVAPSLSAPPESTSPRTLDNPPPAATGSVVPDGPSPHNVDTPRDRVIEVARPLVERCYRTSGSTAAGRVRVVLRLAVDGKVNRVDVTTSGAIPRSVATCSSQAIRSSKFRMQRDTPRFVSFPVLLPP